MALAYSGGIITVTGGTTSGTATSGASTTLTDSGKSWTTNAYANRYVWIHTGTGIGQLRKIVSNTATALTVDRAWTVNPSTDSQYIVSYNFADVKTANDSGAWGVVTATANAYQISAQLFIGDGTSGNRGFFGDNRVSITFTSTSLPTFTNFWTGSHICVKDYSAVSFGVIANATNKTSYDGCSFLTEVTGLNFLISRCTSSGGVPSSANALVSVVSCKFYKNVSTARAIFYILSLTGESTIYNCDFDKTELTPGNATTYNINVQGGQYGLSRVSGAFDRGIVASISGPAVYANPTGEVAGTTFKNLVTRNCTSWFEFNASPTQDVFMVNPDADSKTISVSGGAGTAKLWEQYEFDLSVKKSSDSTALSGARVYIADSTPAQILNTTTDSNGLISTQTLNKGYFTGAGGSNITLRTPHVLKVRRYGYQPMQLSINMTIKQAMTDYRIADSYVVATEANAGNYTGVAIDGSAKTITISSARTVQEMYDYSQWWIVQSGNVQYDVPFSTNDGVTFLIASGWKVIGISNLTFGTKKLSGSIQISSAGTYSPSLDISTITFSGTGTYDLRTANITGNITLINTSGGNVTVQLQPGVSYTNTGPNITVDNTVSATLTVSNIISGSRMLLRRTDTQAVLINEIISGTSKQYTYTWASDIPVEIVLRKASAAPFYQEWYTTSTLVSTSFSITANQILDQ